MMQLLAVLQVNDAFSGRPMIDENVRFHFRVKASSRSQRVSGVHGTSDEKAYLWVRWYPVPKPDGFYAFTRLPDGEPHLRITCPGFFDYELALVTPLRLPLVDAIAVCELKPSPAYSYPSGTTVIRGRITTTRPDEPAALSLSQTQETGRALGGVAVSGSYADPGDGMKTSSNATRSGSKNAGVCYGRYALALPGAFGTRRAAGETDELVVSMTFEKAGYDTVTKKVHVVPGCTTIVTDIAMQ